MRWPQPSAPVSATSFSPSSVPLLGGRIKQFIQITESLPLSNRIAASAIREPSNAIAGKHNLGRSPAHGQFHRDRSTIGKRQI
jgi:hypothetical protein